MMTTLLRHTLPLFFLFVTLSGLDCHKVYAAQQYQGICSAVKLEIVQEATLERTGFLATLQITNNEIDASITDFSSVLTFENPALSVPGALDDSSAMFFVQPPVLKGIEAIDGTGIIKPGETATIQWFIIPKTTAGGTIPVGETYLVGADLGASIYGNRIASDVLEVFPDSIRVLPDARLDITYFQPRDVDGDNPFTPDIVETPVPFTVGVLVQNNGNGAARSMRVVSEQPRIIENKQALQIVAALTGARIDDTPVENTSLTLEMGTIEPGRCRKGAWDMISSLSGEFLEFKASFSHASELGGKATSLINSVNAYFMVHEVLNDQPGRDDLLDFLAETREDGDELIPDTLFESDCTTVAVNRLNTVELINQTPLQATFRATADFENWVFIQVDDPAQAKYNISSIVRSDGKILNPHNYWTHIRYRKEDNTRMTSLNIFDFVMLGQYDYTISYEPTASDTEPPVTNILFTGAFQQNGDTTYLLPETLMSFMADDAGPVSTYYRLDGQVDYLPAYPFTISESGQHTVEYYSQDASGNQETPKTATVFVSGDDPAVIGLNTDTTDLYITGETVSVRSTEINVHFTGSTTAFTLEGMVDVFKGVSAYPTIRNIPSSPTVVDTASLAVGGENVDFYRYRLGNDAWSIEYPVSQSIELSGLTGTIEVSVSGRSQHGAYQTDDKAMTVSWIVDSTAASLAVSGTPASPDRTAQASLEVIGSEYYCYRVDGTYYRPNTTPGEPIILTSLSGGSHFVEVLARTDAAEVCPSNGVGTRVDWTVNRQYGLDFSEAASIRHIDLGQVDTNQVTFSWDGRTDSGAAVPPGWYSVRILVTDGLGRSSGVVTLVLVNDMADGKVLSDTGNAGQKEAHAQADWVVWQDQRNSNWDIYARDLTVEPTVDIALTSSSLNQERPRTDGNYVVWENQQPDGTWDIQAIELDSGQPAFAVTSTTDLDEKKPYVHYPWIVFQAKSVSSPSAPWQLYAYNLLTDQVAAVEETSYDQVDPAIHRQKIVWQDFRDAGSGEIYMKDLVTGTVRRITDNPGGQSHPVIYNQWIVWDDNRNTQVDLYGYNLKRNVELQLTNTPEDESRPFIQDKWVVYQEDSAGEQKNNLRMFHLENFAGVQLTNVESEKEKASMASGRLIWTDYRTGHGEIMSGVLPELQPVFNNRNTVAVTAEMASRQIDAFTLLALWNAEAGVSSITHYSSLVTQPVAEVASWDGGVATGDNFSLQAGDFLWVRFNSTEILDLGQSGCGTIELESGQTAFSYSCFPDNYSAYRLIRELGEDNVTGVRVLNSETGHWQTATVVDGQVTGDDFNIAPLSVLMIETNSALGTWRPGKGL